MADVADTHPAADFICALFRHQPAAYLYAGLSEETIMRIANIVNVGTTAELLRSREIVIAQAMSSQIAKVNADMGLSLTPINFNFLASTLPRFRPFPIFPLYGSSPSGRRRRVFFSESG
jgi:hypothetical protein